MWDNLFSSVSLLEKGIGTSWLRNEVISNNIVNQDTPGFKASQVEFEDLMSAALTGETSDGLEMTTTDARHISLGGAGDVNSVSPLVVTADDTSFGYDENNVDVESEMAALAKNNIEYYTLVSKINSEFRKLDAAINVT